MYNLDVNLASTAAAGVLNGLLAVEAAGSTPRTPEILNSLMAMTNPMDNYNFGDDARNNGAIAAVPSSSKPFTMTSSDSNSSSCSQLESPTNCPSSLQQTRTQLIKAGLKLTIEQKRKHQSDSDDILDLDKCKRIKMNDCSESEDEKVHNNGWFSNCFPTAPVTGKKKRKSRGASCAQDDYYDCFSSSKLTPEDEERRQRRRERNKIAATKCRLKKRERTANLVVESETLEKQNVELKTQVHQLKAEQLNLTKMLMDHRPICQKNVPMATRDALSSHRLPSVSAISSNHSFTRPNSNSGDFRNFELYNRPDYTNRGSYGKPPVIVVDSPTEAFQPQLTNLDASTNYHHNYSNQQCHNYNSGQGYGNTGGMDNGCMA